LRKDNTFLKLVQSDSLNANYNFKVGESYLNIKGQEHLAIPYFERATKKIVPKNRYRKKDFYENSAPLHAYFYLGNAYRMNNQLNEALTCYAKFIDSPYFYDNYNQNIVDREIQSCERAAIIQDAPVEHKKINLGTAINTSFDEEKPVLSGDGNTLVFIRKMKFYDAIFFTRKKDGEWQEPVNINPQVLSDGDYYPTGLSKDGNKMLLVRRKADDYDIHTSVYDGETWSEAEKISGKINTPAAETHASYSPDGKTLYVTSNRPGGKGGFDIWYSQKDKNDVWGKLKNMGKQINTDQDEQIAYLSEDHMILFFSSQGHYSMGGFDIFYSKRDGKKWKLPINIGYPINDTRDNLFYCPLQENSREGVYAIQQDDDNIGASDIYFIKILSESILFFAEDSSPE
jgi:hypothetical protein